MLYRADTFQVDLQIEAPASSRKIVVIGQLLDLRHAEIVGRDVPFMLSNFRGQVIQATTNQFGEFREEIERSKTVVTWSWYSHRTTDKPILVFPRDALGHSTSQKL